MGTDGEEQLSNAFATFFLKLQSCCVHSINVILLKQQLQFPLQSSGSKEIMNSFLAIKMKIHYTLA